MALRKLQQSDTLAHTRSRCRFAGHIWMISVILGLAAARSFAQPVPGGEPDAAPALSSQELEELVGPIALYPDDLVGIILPASTYPLQIVQAARFLDDLEDDASLEPDPDWDNAVVALLNYPEVLRKLNDDLDWTWSLGQAVLNQQSAVIDAIQGFRERAYAAGNLESDEHQVVTEDDDGAIEIKPADPEVVYVPYYEPDEVVVVQPRRVYYYYDYGYPLYYYPYPIGYSFASPFFWGVTSAFAIGWHSHYLHVYQPSYYGHPYYHYPYYAPYYVRRGVNVNINLNSVSHIWRPSDRRAARPLYRTSGNRLVRSSEDYTNDLRRKGRSGAYRSADTAPSYAYPNRTRPSPGRETATTDNRVRPAQPDSRSTSNARSRQGDRAPTSSFKSRSTRSTAGRTAASQATVSKPRRVTGAVPGRPAIRQRNNATAASKRATGRSTPTTLRSAPRRSSGTTSASTVARSRAAGNTPTFAAPRASRGQAASRPSVSVRSQGRATTGFAGNSARGSAMSAGRSAPRSAPARQSSRSAARPSTGRFTRGR